MSQALNLNSTKKSKKKKGTAGKLRMEDTQERGREVEGEEEFPHGRKPGSTRMGITFRQKG